MSLLRIDSDWGHQQTRVKCQQHTGTILRPVSTSGGFSRVPWIQTPTSSAKPLQATTYEARGHAYESLKNAAKAADDFTRALSFDPEGNGGFVYFHRAHAYKKSSRPDLALGDSYHLAKRALEWAVASEAPYDREDRSLSCARWASEVFDHKVPYLLEALAATEARAKKFSEAIRTQSKALELLALQDARRLAAQQRLLLYNDGKSLKERADLLPQPAD